jgi:peptidoglycan/xylan/chitin deacetylase (PgdA/CDA1 family)
LFSFDFDSESALLEADPRNADLPVTMSQSGYGTKVGVYEILRRLAEREVRATFFVPAWTAEHHPAAVEAIVEDGHEVGLHGDLHEPPHKLDAERERETLGRSIEILEKVCGSRPVGYRAPWWEVSTVTFDLLAEFGVRYGSQMMDDVFPYFHETRNGEVLELPVDWALDDGAYSRVLPNALPTGFERTRQTNADVIGHWTAEFDGIAAMGGLFVLTMHPEVTGRPSRLPTLESILDRATQADDVWVATGQEIDEYWRRARPERPDPRAQLRSGLKAVAD